MGFTFGDYLQFYWCFGDHGLQTTSWQGIPPSFWEVLQDTWYTWKRMECRIVLPKLQLQVMSTPMFSAKKKWKWRFNVGDLLQTVICDSKHSSKPLWYSWPEDLFLPHLFLYLFAQSQAWCLFIWALSPELFLPQPLYLKENHWGLCPEKTTTTTNWRRSQNYTSAELVVPKSWVGC